ncbi:MAG: hypothetical protein U0871_23740 [Gemmataceae bacterium]
MSDELLAAARPLLDRLAETLAGNEPLRRQLADLARATATWLDALPRQEPVAADPAPPAVQAPAAPPPAVALPDLPRDVWVRFPLAATTPAPPAPRPVEDDELSLVPLGTLAARCRVKADAARWVGGRLTATSAPYAGPDEAELRQRADALPDCFLWMLADRPLVPSPRVWADLAGAYSTAAAGAELLAAWEALPAAAQERHQEEVLRLAAEAQSLLMYAVSDTRGVRQDFEQIQLFVRVREHTRRRQVFIPRYLKRDDYKDPATWPELADRLGAAAAAVREAGGRDKARQKTLNNLRFKLRKLRDDPAANADEWPRVLELIDEAVGGGLPPSHAELRDLLLPVMDRMPDEADASPGVGLVLREVDRYLAERPQEEPPAAPEPPGPDLAEVGSMLRGREVVLIGGQVRPAHKAALIRAFDLADVRWLSTPEHTSYTVFEPDIARPEVAVVLLAIRWVSHSYAEIDQFCQRYGKPLVRLRAGYNPNQVAHQILTQAGQRLRAAGSPA